MMTTTTRSKKVASAKANLRRAIIGIVVLTILLFFIGAMLIVEISPIALLPDQLSIISDIFIIVLILCPLALCGLPLYIAIGAGVFGLIRLDAGTAYRLRKLQQTSKKVQHGAEKVTTAVAKRSIQFHARFEFLRPLFQIFDRVEDEQQHDGQQSKLEE